ncbi:hypothetical protein [Desertivirga xinjiangensis]|uniref:hypothetical protein n=1 Tax=Desertivirga xinjiangensis TaxID=539206 RepID=UPI0034E24A19
MAFRATPRVTRTEARPTEENPNAVLRHYERVPAMSAGLSLRVNVFGYFILEPYAAIPFQRTDVNGPVFGLTFAPGW